MALNDQQQKAPGTGGCRGLGWLGSGGSSQAAESPLGNVIQQAEPQIVEEAPVNTDAGLPGPQPP